MLSAGDLDQSFGVGGIAIFDGNTTQELSGDLVVQPDGKILEVGRGFSDGTYFWAITRLLPDGQLDPGFGDGGRVLTYLGGQAPSAQAVALQPDGKIVVAGYVFDAYNRDYAHGYDFALLRYLPDGRLDPSFGDFGVIETDLGGMDLASDLEIQPDGKILVAGSTAPSMADLSDVAIVRYLPDGRLDRDFGREGVFTTTAGDYLATACLALQPDGGILVASAAMEIPTGPDGVPVFESPVRVLATLRLRSDGQLDPGFGVGGQVRTYAGDINTASGVSLQADGRIIVSTKTDKLLRFLDSGGLDPTFGDGGVATAPPLGPPGTFIAQYLSAVQADGKIVVTGQLIVPDDNMFPVLGDRRSDILVGRFLADGRPDPAFGDGGFTITDTGGIYERPNAVVIQPDGKIVVSGYVDIRLAPNVYRDALGILRYEGSDQTPNAPPVAHAGGPYSITEGDALALDASASEDPDGDPLTYSWDVDGDGVFGDASGVSPTLTWGQLQALGVDGPNAYEVRVRVADGSGNAVVSAPTTLEVANLAPVATLTGDGPALDGDPITVRFVDAYDPSAADRAAGLRYAFATDPAALDGVSYPTAGIESSASFRFAEAGPHTVYGRVFDKDGGSNQFETVLQITHVAPAVVAFVVNGGAAQRSNVERAEVRFNRSTNVPEMIADGTIVDSVQVVGTSRIVLDAGRYRYDPASLTLVIDLTVDGFGGSSATMLGDGRYQLRLDTASITAPGIPGNRLIDDDGASDGWVRLGFHRLEGDFDGDAVVTLADRSALLAHFGSRTGQGAYDFAYDLNGDGVISLADYLLWSRRLGRRV